MSDTGIRYPYPSNRENCCLGPNGEKFKGWVAKARWRLSDQIVLVAAYEVESSFRDKYTATDNSGNPLTWEYHSESVFKPHIWRGSFIPDPDAGLNAGMKFDYYYFSASSSSDGNPPTEDRLTYSGGIWGLIDCSQVKAFLDEGVRELQPVLIDNSGGGPWFVLCGEVGPVLRAYKKFAQAAQSQDLNVAGDDPYYGTSGVGDQGLVVGRHIYTYVYKTKCKIVAECHRRDLEAPIAHLFKKDPFKTPHFGRTVTSCHELEYEKEMPLETQKRFKWQHLKNYTPQVSDRATYNWVGSDKGFNQQLYPPADKIGAASARLQDVEFFFCEGCGPHEIECLDKATNTICCVDCCKLGKWINEEITNLTV